jgi:hypothetical protein
VTDTGTAWSSASAALIANDAIHNAIAAAHVYVFAITTVNGVKTVDDSSGALATGFVANSLAVSTTPEPSTLAIAGVGALGFIGYGLRRRKAAGA